MDDRVVYLILSHDNPGQVLRLVERLRKGNPEVDVVVHHDHARTTLDPGVYADAPDVHFLRHTQGVRWGRFSQVEMVLQSLRWAVEHLRFGWLVLLSGQDYPLRPLERFHRQLATTQHDAFVSATPIPLERPRDGEGRYRHARYLYRYYEIPPVVPRRLSSFPQVRRLLLGAQRRISFGQPLVFLWPLPEGGGNLIGFRRRRLPFDHAFRCYVGSQWLIVSRRSVEVIDQFVRDRESVVRLYRRTVIPDESLLVTILCNDSRLYVCHDNQRYVRMGGEGRAHPRILRSGDLEALLASGKPFARKFDDRVDAEVLDLLDRRIDGVASREPLA